MAGSSEWRDDAMTECTRLHIRQMTIEDIDEVVEVENAVFSSPWTKQAFYHELLHNRFAVYFVAESARRVVGYVGLWVVYEDANITNIALLPDYRGFGYGEQLMKTAMQYAKGNGAKKMSLEVRVSNERAKRLYQKLGFRHGGIRKNYYTDNLEDASVMWVML